MLLIMAYSIERIQRMGKFDFNRLYERVYLEVIEGSKFIIVQCNAKSEQKERR